MSEYFKKYLKQINFEKNLNKLNKKLKNKKIIIYGTGLLFQHIQKNFNLSNLNIIGVSDIKFSNEQVGDKYLGYNVIPKALISEYKPDYVIVASENYIGLLDSLSIEFKNDNIKFLPLAKKKTIDIIKTIWSIS